MTLGRVFALATTLVFAGTVPVAVIASREFRDASFYAMLGLVPVVLPAPGPLKSNVAVGVAAPPVVGTVTSTVATVGTLVAGLSAAGCVWRFARPFARLDGGSVETTTRRDAPGGFGRVGAA